MPQSQFDFVNHVSVLPKHGRRNIAAINRDDIEADLGLLIAETWPARHKVHKYWGRKPANIVSSCVEYFSAGNETVMDPFSGSGVTVIEASGLGRRSIGYDFNPFAVRLGQALLSPPNCRAFVVAAEKVINSSTTLARGAFTSHCRYCKSEVLVRSYGYQGSGLQSVRYKCPHCRNVYAGDPSPLDISLASSNFEAPPGTPDAPILFGWEMQKLRRKGAKRWRDLFSSRNYFASALIWHEIHKVSDSNVREWLLLTFTASLAQFTRMIADSSGDAGGPSWKINCYWLPDKWQELNPLQYFSNRVRRSAKAILDLQKLGAPFTQRAAIKKHDSRSLPLAEASVDYIFTDPPYGGEGVQYGELSMLWSLWLGEAAELEKEIAYNPYRQLSSEHYEAGLRKVISEAHRVLKPGRWMTVTFANKDPEVWDALMASCKDTGFRLVTAAPMKRSAPALTETNMRQAPKADLLLSFQKPKIHVIPLKPAGSELYNLEQRVEKIAAKIIVAKNTVASRDIFDRITIDWFSWFYENGPRPTSIRPTLNQIESVLSALGIRYAV